MTEQTAEQKPPDAEPAPPRRAPEPEPLTERVADWRPEDSASVDAAARVVRGVALCGPTSRNGYAYPEAVLRAAAPLYEGAPVFLDHAETPPVGRPAGRPFGRGRSARDYVGSVRDVRFEEGRLRGDVAALDTPAGRTFLALAAGDDAGRRPAGRYEPRGAGGTYRRRLRRHRDPRGAVRRRRRLPRHRLPTAGVVVL